MGMSLSQHNNDTGTHQTNVTALLVLVAVTAVFVVAISSASSSDQLNASRQTKAATSQTQLANAPSVPELPADLPPLQSSDIIQNYYKRFASDKTQHVLIYRTDATLKDLSASYRDWLTHNGFSLATTETKDKSAAFVAEGRGKQIVVVIASHGDRRQVELNYVKM